MSHSLTILYIYFLILILIKSKCPFSLQQKSQRIGNSILIRKLLLVVGGGTVFTWFSHGVIGIFVYNGARMCVYIVGFN